MASGSNPAITTPGPPIMLEVCIDNLQSGIAAEAGGAKRIELCSSLSEGGLTPSVGFLKIAKSVLTIPIFTMIRPRGGDFCYSPDEIRIMEEDIISLKENGADGIVLGVLTPCNEINIEVCTKLLLLAYPLPVTFHRAFDLVPDQFKSLDTLITLGVQRILTSGQASTAEKGAERILKLIGESRGKITIMAGSGVTLQNVKKLIEKCNYNLTEVHGSFRTVKKPKKLIPSMIHDAITMGSNKDEMNLWITDKDIVQKIVASLADLQQNQRLGKDKEKDRKHLFRKMDIGSPTEFSHVYHAGKSLRDGLQFDPNMFKLSAQEIAELSPAIAAIANNCNLNRTRSAPSTPTKADAATSPTPPFPKPRPVNSPVPGTKPIPLPRTKSLTLGIGHEQFVRLRPLTLATCDNDEKQTNVDSAGPELKSN